MHDSLLTALLTGVQTGAILWISALAILFAVAYPMVALVTVFFGCLACLGYVGGVILVIHFEADF